MTDGYVYIEDYNEQLIMLTPVEAQELAHNLLELNKDKPQDYTASSGNK